MLSKDYTRVVTAASGWEAIGWLEVWLLGGHPDVPTEHPVIVLSDVDMPNGTGFDVATWCQKNDVGCVLWSGSAGGDGTGSTNQRTATALGLPGTVVLKGQMLELREALRKVEEACGISR